MAFNEKVNWVILVAGALVLPAYLALVVPPALSEPISGVAYELPLIGAIVAFIALCILGMIVAAATNPTEADKQDQRDKEIDHLGERVGNSFIGLGFVLVLILALIKADHFWIASAIFVTGMAGGVLGAITKIAAYHGPFQRW